MILLTFSAYNLKLIQNSYDEIKNLINILGGELSPLPRFPSKKRRITVLKSPHVNTKAKEQLEWISYKSQCKIIWKKTSNIENQKSLFILGISNLDFPGTQLNIKTLFNTHPLLYDAKI